jgi:hypothetical protein
LGEQRWIYQMKVIAISIGVSLFCGPAVAQQVDPAAATAVQSRKAYDDCVYQSVAAQLRKMAADARQNADFSFLGEQSFLACAAEERVLGMNMIADDFSPSMVQATLLGIRAQIKRTIRQIVADPGKYAK